MQHVTTIPLCLVVALVVTTGCSRQSPGLDAINAQLSSEQKAVGAAVENSIGMILVPIPQGMFQMGSKQKDRKKWFNLGEEFPQHRVEITDNFLIGVSEVTQAQYFRLMGEKPWEKKPLVGVSPDAPASYISFKKAQEFCEKLSQKENRQYRLPTESEWEYACRSGSQTIFYFSDDPKELGDYAWYFQNAYKSGEQYPRRWGMKAPNHWVLFDMHGNVCEWCSDFFASYPKDAAGRIMKNPKGPDSGKWRVWRGGGVIDNPRDLRSATRNSNGRAHYRPEFLAGFRVVCEMENEVE